VLLDQRQRFLIAMFDESRTTLAVVRQTKPAIRLVLALFRASDARTVLTADLCWS
jgi:hypothetical protein